MAAELKKLVVYYSLSGNSKFIANAIAEAIQADTLELQTKKSFPSNFVFQLFTCGFQTLFKQSPELLPLTKNPADYDVVFIGTPVWVGGYASPLRTLFSTMGLTGKKIGLFCSYGGSAGKSLEKMKETLAGNEILGEIGFRDPLKNEKEKNAQQAQEWAKGMLAKL